MLLSVHRTDKDPRDQEGRWEVNVDCHKNIPAAFGLKKGGEHALDHICDSFNSVRTGIADRLHAGRRHSCPAGHRHRRDIDSIYSRTKTSVTIFDAEQATKHPMNDRRDTMKSSTKDNAEGKMHQLKGKGKQILAKILKNRKLKAEGKAENLDGNVQEKIGKFKKVVGK